MRIETETTTKQSNFATEDVQPKRFSPISDFWGKHIDYMPSNRSGHHILQKKLKQNTSKSAREDKIKKKTLKLSGALYNFI